MPHNPTEPQEFSTPGDPMPDWELYHQHAVADNTRPVGWKIAGFTDPEGNYFDMSDDEELIHVLNDENTSRDTFVRRADGVTTPVDKWKLSGHDETSDKPEKEKDELDRPRLNEIMHKAGERGVLFGRGLELTDHDKEQFRLIISKADSFLTPMREDSDWKEFEALRGEGAAKGVLLSFVTHKDTHVPDWCVLGGVDTKVRKVLRPDPNGGNGLPGIEVPSKIFNFLNYSNAVEIVEKYAKRSNETTYGTSTDTLGHALYTIGYFLNHMENQEEAKK